MRPLIIGIAGGTGSGKTTLVENLKEQFGADISVLPHDNYYAAHHDMSLEERQTLNYDHPAAFDTDRMIQDLEDLKAGKTIQCPVYDYAIHDRTEATLTLAPNKVILVEGGHPHFREQGPAGPDGHQNFRGYRRGRAHSAPHFTGRQGARPDAGIRHGAVSYDG